MIDVNIKDNDDGGYNVVITITTFCKDGQEIAKVMEILKDGFKKLEDGLD